MSFVKLNPQALRPKMIPVGMLDAEIVSVTFPYVAPWDEENTGANWRFRIVDDNYPDFKGRQHSEFTSATEGKPFADKFEKFCKGLGLDLAEGFDTDDLEGMKVVLEMGSYYSTKNQEDRNSLNNVLKR